jgi:hypothetical protein
MLGYEVSDNAKDRLENMEEIEAALAKANHGKGRGK